MSIIQSVALAGASGQGGGGDLGEPIEQSVRFDGAQRLVGPDTQPTGNYTFACWFKRGDEPTGTGLDTLLCFTGNESFQFVERSSGLIGSSSGLSSRHSGTLQAMADGVMTDYSGWYHICFTVTSNTITTYINGIKQSTSPTEPSGSDNMCIGSNSASVQDEALEGYLAEVNLLDGHVVGDTGGILNEFGRVNRDGIWVPKKVDGAFTAAQYGDRGFRLQFQDDANPGDDTAPVGASGHTAANDFTATGFNTTAIARHSSDVSTPAGGFPTANKPTAMFDGSTVTFCQPNNTGTYTFTPSTAISYTSLEIWSAGAKVSLNGGAEQQPATGSFQSIDSSSGTLTSLAFISPTGVAGAAIRAIRINGSTILTDNITNDVNFSDTPSQNFATLNPLKQQAAGSDEFSDGLQDGYLKTSSSSGGAPAFSSIRIPNNAKIFAEFIPDGTTSGNGGVGVQYAGATGTNSFFIKEKTIQWNCSSTTNKIFIDAVDSSSTHTPPGNWVLSQKLVHGIGVDTTLSPPQVTFFAADGTSVTVPFPNDHDPDHYYFMAATNVNGSIRWNFGQKIAFGSLQPAGHSALQNKNLPDPTIKDGRDHFDVVTYDGTGSAKSETGLGFQPDFVWIKKRSNEVESHVLTDSVRGTTKSCLSDSTAVEVTSSDRLTAFNSDGFSVGTDVSVNQSGRTYVAWCWKAGGAAVSNTNGTITSSVSANTDAGFSIVSYTGNQTAGATIGHGLTKAPEVVFIKTREIAGNWAVYHIGQDATAPEDKFLILNSTATPADNVNRFNDTKPTNTVFSVGNNNTVNQDTKPFIAYCWHPVEGYSKFGSFVGNNNANGPFIYTGFTPRLVIYKRTDQTGPWNMADSKRAPFNPSDNELFADTNGQETSSADQNLDILSNGFKLRNNSVNRNSGSGTYIYMAFAEHPFGGENAPPATARV